MDKFTKSRKFLSTMAGVILVIILLFIEPLFLTSVFNTVLGYAGLLMVGVAMAGRSYSSVYISGYKTQKLIMQGPYSITRNPLYFFSFLGYIGITAAFGSIVLIVIVSAIFLLYYIPLMREEESRLTDAFGEDFSDYKKRVPLFIPRSWNIEAPEDYSVRTPSLLPNIFDTVWFLVAYVVLSAAAELHSLGILYALIVLP